MPCAWITDLSQTIWTDLGAPTGQPPAYIQSKLVSQAYVGRLNNLLGTCYVSVSGDISPEMGNQEQGIFSLVFEADYYTTQLNRVMQGLIGGGAAISLADGDSRIVLTSPVDAARIFRDAKKEAISELMDQVIAYRANVSLPSAVDLPTVISTWYGGGAGYGMNGNPHNWYRS